MLNFVKHSHVGKPADMAFVHFAATANHFAVVLYFIHGCALSENKRVRSVNSSNRKIASIKLDSTWKQSLRRANSPDLIFRAESGLLAECYKSGNVQFSLQCSVLFLHPFTVLQLYPPAWLRRLTPCLCIGCCGFTHGLVKCGFGCFLFGCF